MPAHMPSTATPVRYEFKAKSLWTKVDKAQPLKNLARRFAVAVRLYSRGVVGNAPLLAVRTAKKSPKTKRKTARRFLFGAPFVLAILFYALRSAFLRSLYLRCFSAFALRRSSVFACLSVFAFSTA